MTTVPKPQQLVKFDNKIFNVLSCDLGGKCKLKKSVAPDKGKILKEIDISELEAVN